MHSNALYSFSARLFTDPTGGARYTLPKASSASWSLVPVDNVIRSLLMTAVAENLLSGRRPKVIGKYEVCPVAIPKNLINCDEKNALLIALIQIVASIVSSPEPNPP